MSACLRGDEWIQANSGGSLAGGKCQTPLRKALFGAGVIEMTDGRSVRALYGVCACSSQLAGVKGQGGSRSLGTSEDKEAGEALAKLAAEALQQCYALTSPEKLPLVKAMLAIQRL